MKNLFIVGSCIHTRHGQFPSEERLAQTIETLKSIALKVPDCKILLNESSIEKALSEDDLAALRPHYTYIANYHDDAQVQSIYKASDNFDVVKNYTEMLVMGKTLDLLVNSQSHMLTGIDRVFKLSGRYRLNDNFNILNFDKPEKYIFASRRASQFANTITNGLSQQLMSRLWSFPVDKLDLVLSRFKLMIEDFVGSLQNQVYRDTEHLLMKYFDGPNLLELPIVGVEGNLGPNKQFVSD